MIFVTYLSLKEQLNIASYLNVSAWNNGAGGGESYELESSIVAVE